MKKLIILSFCFTALFFANTSIYAQKKVSFKTKAGIVEFSGEQILEHEEFGQAYLSFGKTALNLYTIRDDVYIHFTITYSDIPIKDPAFKWNYEADKIKDLDGTSVFILKIFLDKIVAKVWAYPGSAKEDVNTYYENHAGLQFNKKEDALKFLEELKKRCN